MQGISFIPLSSRSAADAGNFDAALALGCFDGFHRAHRTITDAAAALCGDRGCLHPGVFCFSEPPAAFFGKEVPTLTDREEKYRLFAEAGMEYVFEADFSALRELSPDAFLKDVLYGYCRCRAAACGFNFTFGRGALGTPRELAAFFGKGAVNVCPPLLSDETPISSSRIRELVASGKIEKANALLGHPFSIGGQVEHGRGDGRRLGFPTINQRPATNAARAAAGVYVSIVEIRDAHGVPHRYPAVTDAGTAPTMDTTGSFRYETHLIDVGDIMLYGASPRVFLLARLRDEKSFTCAEELTLQVERDIAAAREYLNRDGVMPQ